jgi:homoserine kinase type II
MKTPELLRIGFAELARIHDVLRSTSLPAGARTSAHANHIEAEDALAASRRGADRIREWGEAHLARFADDVVDHVAAVAEREKGYRASQRRQIVHGDFWDNNVLFDGEQIAAVLDFEFMAERPRVDDLALTIYFYLLEPGHGPPTDQDLQLVRLLVQAYNQAANHRYPARSVCPSHWPSLGNQHGRQAVGSASFPNLALSVTRKRPLASFRWREP